MTFDAILFDKDGTLFHFEATWEAWAESFLFRAAGQDRDRAQIIGGEIGFDFAARQFVPDSLAIAGTPDQLARALAPHVPEMTPGEVLDMLNEEAAMAEMIEAVPLVGFLDGLRAQGMRLGIATNDAEMPAMAHLRAAGIEEKFDFIAGSDSGHGAKPDPGQMLAFARSVQTEPERIVMVGDSTHDLQAGRAAGMATVGVLTGIAQAEELAPFADVVLPDIGHLPGWLGHEEKGMR